MRAGRWRGVFWRFAKEPDGRGAEKREERGPTEDVDVGEQRGLLQETSVDQAHRARAGRGWSKLVAEI